jgi:transposase InsO family protein
MRPPRFLGSPYVHASVSDPGGSVRRGPGPAALSFGFTDVAFRVSYRVGPASDLSGLSSSAYPFAVYASSAASRPHDARLAPPGDLQPWADGTFTRELLFEVSGATSFLFDQAFPGAQDTVAKYMPKPPGRPRRPASQTWKTFLRNHLVGTIAIDFLTVPTVTFDIIYVFFVLSLERRRVLHVNVTAHPRAAWTAQQIVEAIGTEVVPARLVRDRDAIFGTVFDARVENLGIRQFRIAPRSPWQNGFAERWVGTLRREQLDHVIVLGERHRLRLAGSTSPTTTRTDPICRWAPTHRPDAPSNHQTPGTSSHFRASDHRYLRAA